MLLGCLGKQVCTPSSVSLYLIAPMRNLYYCLDGNFILPKTQLLDADPEPSSVTVIGHHNLYLLPPGPRLTFYQ